VSKRKQTGETRQRCRGRGEDRGGETEGKRQRRRNRGEGYRRRNILETNGKRQRRTESAKVNWERESKPGAR
jgi:hypothetical protein